MDRFQGLGPAKTRPTSPVRTDIIHTPRKERAVTDDSLHHSCHQHLTPPKSSLSPARYHVLNRTEPALLQVYSVSFPHPLLRSITATPKALTELKPLGVMGTLVDPRSS